MPFPFPPVDQLFEIDLEVEAPAARRMATDYQP